MRVEKPRQRAVQQRAEDTQEAIIQAGIELFSGQGYEGTSIRAIEEASGTKRGLVNYHFGNKEALWKTVASRVFGDLPIASEATLSAAQDLGEEAQLRAYLTDFIRFSAEHPELSRIIIQEGKAQSWRLDYLLENYVRPRLELFKRITRMELDAHSLYIFLGAATLVFDVEAECENLFGFNPRSDEFIREHAIRVCDMVIATF